MSSSISLLVFQSFGWSYILNSRQGSIQQLFLPISHSVMSQFSMLISISFPCVFCSSIESLHVPSCRLRQLCFFLCSQTSPLLQSQPCQCLFLSLHRMSLRCPHHLQIWCSDRRRFCHQCYSFQLFSFRLNDEAQHLALCRLNHSFVFTARRPCSRCVAKSRRDRGVEETQAEFEHVFLRC